MHNFMLVFNSKYFSILCFQKFKQTDQKWQIIHTIKVQGHPAEILADKITRKTRITT